MTLLEIGILIFAVFVFLFALLLGFGYYAYRFTFCNNPEKRRADPYRHVKDDGSLESEYSRRLIDEMLARPYENVYITSHDGLKLRARLYMQNEKAPFAVGMHGYRSTPMLDFSGGGAFALELGFNLILPDQRACGESEGRTISFGYNESFDTLGWVKYISERWGEDREIILLGVSLGAGTVVMAAGRGLPENVRAVIADCPFSSAEKIVKKVMRDRGIPVVLYPLLRFGTAVFGGFDPNKATPTELAGSVKVPLTLIHGEDDTFVPPSMSEEILAACPTATLHTFPRARHGTSYIVDTARYKKITAELLSAVIKDKKELNLNDKDDFNEA